MSRKNSFGYLEHAGTQRLLARLVVAAGFTSVDMCGDTDGAPYRLGSPRLLLAARRPFAR